MMNDCLEQDLRRLMEQGLLRTLKLRTGKSARIIHIDSKSLLNFCSNDYLGLASDARLIVAAKSAMDLEGFGSGASRLVTGNLETTEILEQDIAKLKGFKECLVFNSGYSANTGIIPALMGREDIVFSDKLNHASIVDGIILSRAECKRYPHLDLGILEEGLKNSSTYRRRLIVTDSVFSMDGDKAPLKEIVSLAKRYDAWVMVDEAHAFGILGANGSGLAKEQGVEQDIDIQMGTLSKAAGCFGAYVCGRKPLRSYLINHARSFVYTTALPPAVIAAARIAVGIILSTEGEHLRKIVLGHAEYLRAKLKDLGFDTLNSKTPIIPVVLKDAHKAVAVSRFLYDKGFYVSAIRPPTVPVNMARLRITVTAGHNQEDLDNLIDAMRAV